MKRHRLALTAAALCAGALVLGGCAHPPPAGPMPDYRGPGAVTLYLQRRNQPSSAVQSIHVVLDGATLGQIYSGEYWRLRVKPGWHWLGTWEGAQHVRLAPGATRCYEFGYTLSAGAYLGRAPHCPPPPGWTPAHRSGH